MTVHTAVAWKEIRYVVDWGAQLPGLEFCCSDSHHKITYGQESPIGYAYVCSMSVALDTS